VVNMGGIWGPVEIKGEWVRGSNCQEATVGVRQLSGNDRLCACEARRRERLDGVGPI